MAASVVGHILNDPVVFSSWPHCGGIYIMLHLFSFFVEFPIFVPRLLLGDS